MALDIQQLMQSLSEMMGGTPPSFGAQAGNYLTGQDAPGNTGGLGSLMTLKNGQAALGGLSAISGILNSTKANQLAKDQFKFTKDVTNTNLNNQIKSYNTALGDRANARAFTQNQDQSVADAYYDKNRLNR